MRLILDVRSDKIVAVSVFPPRIAALPEREKGRNVEAGTAADRAPVREIDHNVKSLVLAAAFVCELHRVRDEE